MGTSGGNTVGAGGVLIVAGCAAETAAIDPEMTVQTARVEMGVADCRVDRSADEAQTQRRKNGVHHACTGVIDRQ